MTLEKITNHVEQANNRLIELYKNSPRVKGLLKSLITPIQALEDEIDNVYKLRWVPTATGQQLNNIGAMVGEYRNGRNDEIYRAAILTRIAINIGAGEPEILINVIRQLYNTSNINYSEQYPASFTIAFQSDKVIANINSLLETIRPAGVGNGTLIQYFEPPFVYGALIGAEADLELQDEDGINDLELETEDGLYGLSMIAEDIYEFEGCQGFAYVTVNNPSLSLDDGSEYDLGDGTILQLQIINAHEDYTISEYGGRLAVAL